MLATLAEYLPTLRPESVLWIFYEGNDLVDLDVEKRFRVLTRYLDPAFSQALWQRQDEIDAAGRSLVETDLGEPPNPILERTFGYGRIPGRFFSRELGKLWNLRRLLGLTRPPTPDVELFRAILSRAQSLVRTWEGELYFVSLPMYQRRLDKPSSEQSLTPKQVVDLTAALGIPFIDVRPSFLRVADSDALWSGTDFYPAHYSEEGYRIVASTIAEHLAGSGP